MENKHNKTETNSYIQTTEWQLSEGKEGRKRTMGKWGQINADGWKLDFWW